MRQDIKQQWITALRSGDYEQGEGYLRTPEGYCCLGVLCELAVNAGVIPAPEDEDDDYIYGVNGRSKYYLPNEVRAWAEMRSDNPTVPVNTRYGEGTVGEERNLSRLNDDGYTFSEIADLIEQHL